MTVFASVLLYFIENIGVLFSRYRFVAFVTGQLPVLSVEFKGSAVMIKVNDFPQVGSMAPEAVGLPVVLKLPEMYVGMTLGAGGREAGELLGFTTGRIFFPVAVSAGGSQVRAVQGKSGF
jgi:hypothetical protein